MKLIIDVPSTFKELADADDFKTLNSPVWYAIIIDCIKNGTVIPDKYGRLIDADAMINELCTHEASEYFGCVTCAEISDFIDDAPTIIPADGES